MLYNWFPYRMSKDEEGWMVSWMDLGDHVIAEPFFDETILHSRIYMKNRSRFEPKSGLNLIYELADQLEFIEPTAFIFHVSRCGSTLLSQCLATQTEHIVIPEAPLFDEILRMDEQEETDPADKEKLFRAAVKIMGQKRLKQQQRFFIKLDSWHIHFYDLLRKWYPNTPFYFLTREPKAVIQSHQKRRGMHMVPDLVHERWLNLHVSQRHFQNFDSFAADVLQEFYTGLSLIRQKAHAKDYFFDYSQGAKEMLRDFNLMLSSGLPALDEMIARLTYHSKYPEQVFKEEFPDWDDFPYQSCLNAYFNLLQYNIT